MIALGLLLVLLLSLIVLSIYKLAIYFASYIKSQKKSKYDIIKTIEENSFYNHNYKNLSMYNARVDIAYTANLILLALWAGIFYIFKNIFKLSYYYGDSTEYYFVDYFFKIIIILSVVCFILYMLWYSNYSTEDQKFEESDKELKNYILENLDYAYIVQIFKGVKAGTKEADYTNVNTYLNKNSEMLNDNLKKFKLCLTYEIMTTVKFPSLGKKLINICKELQFDYASLPDGDIEQTIKTKISSVINDDRYYIIANYSHYDDTPLPTLNVLINNLSKNIKEVTQNQKVKNLQDDSLSAKPSQSVKDVKDTYYKGKNKFKDTIRLYNVIFDKYYKYYMYNIFITNVFLIYVVLILIYVVVINFKNFYSFKTYFNKYGIVIVTVYYSLTTPLILFGLVG